MTRYGYALLLVAVVVGGAAPLFYRTESMPQGIPQLTAEFGGVSLRLDLATTTEARRQGLGGKENLPGDYGMLFVFPREERYGFWMKDMLIPIDIFWLDAQGHVVSLEEQIATSSYPTVFYPNKPALYVLETAAGFAQAHHISEGVQLLLKNPPTVSK